MAERWSRATTEDGQEFVFAASGEGPLVVLLHGFPDTPHVALLRRSQPADAGPIDVVVPSATPRPAPIGAAVEGEAAPA